MIRNYLITAFRSMTRNRSHMFINVLGLVIGISFSCMLYVYVSHELSYDTFHEKSDRIFRILTVDQRNPEQVRRYGVAVPPLGPELENNYPQVVDMVRLHRFVGQVVFKMNDTNFQERDWYMTDPNFFDVFDFKFISGDKSTALEKPFSLVLTESMAKKYFGDKDPVGEIIAETSFGPVTVTGVIEDLPENSHLHFNMLFSQVSTADDWTNYINSWETFAAYTYIGLNGARTIAGLRAEIPKPEQRRLAKFDGGITVG